MKLLSTANGCPLCGGARTAGTTTFSADVGTGVLVVRHVPATVCEQCGEAWIEDETAAKLEEHAHDARRRGVEVEVIAL